MSRNKTLQLAIAGTLIAAATPMLSQAASYTDGRSTVTFPVKKAVSYAAPLADIVHGDPAIKGRVLDWRQPSLELKFDLSEADYTDQLELLLTADPLSKVSARTPVIVQFNNDTPRRIMTRGQGFDARIQLDPAKVRARNNTVRITYETPRDATCVMPQHGAWLIDLKNSKLVVKGRAKSRSLQLREVEMRLDLPAIAPRRVGVVALGANATTLQSLAAQGVGLRMETLPKFTTVKGAGDFEIIMVRRDQLSAYTNDSRLLEGSGPRVYVPRGRPMRLFITGDTDAQVLETAQTFATRELPKARRQMTSLGEMQMQSPFSADMARISGAQKLADIPGTHFVSGWEKDDWASGPQALRFSVSDPAATSGQVELKLSSSGDIAADSKLRVALNGELIGSARLDKSRKTVSFNIRPGSLRGVDNVLTLTPEIKTNSLNSCAADQTDTPNFFLGNGSKIVLNNSAPSPVTELSRLAATGAPFSDAAGAESYIALPTSAADYNASLRVLAQIAKVSGQSLTDAHYARTANITDAGDRHVLVISPSNRIEASLRKSAPAAFQQALKGQAISGDNLLSTAYGQVVSADASQLFQMYAAQYAKTGRIRAGGVAAMFGSDNQMGRVVGVITNTPGQSFKAATDYMLQADHWNELEGGVARWNSRSMLLAQTATNVPGYSLPKSNVPQGDLFANLSWPEWNMPSADGLKQFGSQAGVSIKAGMTGLMAKLGTSADEPNTPRVENASVKTAVTSQPAKPAVASAPKPKAPSFLDGIVSAPKAAKTATEGAVRRQASLSQNRRLSPSASKPLAETVRGEVPKLRGPINLSAKSNGWAQTTRKAARNTKMWITDKVAATKSWANDFKFTRKVNRLQDQVRPMGEELKRAIPRPGGAKAAAWVDRNMSPAALILILAFGFIFLLMALSSPQSRLGGRH